MCSHQDASILLKMSNLDQPCLSDILLASTAPQTCRKCRRIQSTRPTFKASRFTLVQYLRRGDESQPRARLVLFPQRNVVAARLWDTLDTTFYTWHCTLLTPCWVTDCMSHSTLHVFQTLLPSIFSLLLTILLQFLSPHSSLHTLHSLHSLHSTLYTEAQTICSCNRSSVSLLIPLQTLLFRTPTNAALRWASEFLHFPPFSTCFGRFSFIFCSSFLIFPSIPPFSSIFSLLSTIFLCFLSYLFPVIPPFTFLFCRFFPTFFSPGIPPCSSIFPLFYNDFPSFFSYLFPVIPPFSSIFLHSPPVFNDFPSFSVVFFLPFSWHSSIFLFPVIPPFSSIFHPFSTIFLPFLSFFLPFSWHSFIFPLFSTIFLRFFPTFFLHDFPSFSLVCQRT